MGNTDTKLNFRKAVIQLTTKTAPVDAADDVFWEQVTISSPPQLSFSSVMLNKCLHCQFWTDSVASVQDVFTLVPAAEIRALREESPSNLATLVYKSVERLVRAADASCRTQKDQTQVSDVVIINPGFPV